MSKRFQGKSNVILIGPMGVGKTTIGRQLAKSLKLCFKDSDREIEHHTGADIPLIFELEGEAGFRRREHAMIEELCHKADLLLATGGGAIIDERNRKMLQASGVVIYLCADIAHLIERTSRDAKRPLLQTKNPAQRIAELVKARDPLYREIADFVINTSGSTVKMVIKEILLKLK